MSLSITPTRNDLLSEARAEFNRDAALRATITGKKAEALPPDTVLIAADPALSAGIQAADASTLSSTATTAPPATTSASPASSGDGKAPSGGAEEQNGHVLNLMI